METYLTRITDYLITQSWQIALLVVVIAVVSSALRNKSAHVRYLLWLIVLAKCLVPPLLTVPLAILPQEKPAMLFEVVGTTISEPPILPADPAAMAPVPMAMERPAKINIRQWLGAAWLVGAITFLIFNSSKAVRANYWLWRQRKALSAELLSDIENLFSAHGIRNFPDIWQIDGIGQPFVWGLLRGSIYLPANFLNIKKPEHQKSVLGHELSHIVRFDAAVNFLQVIVQAIFWFHPFVWWANKKIRAEREKCCDEIAVARLNTLPRDYSKAIVETLVAKYESTRPVPSLAVAGPVKNIEERIKTMMKPGKKFYKRPSLVAATIVILIALLTVPTALVLTACAETKDVAEPEVKPAKSLPQAAKDGDIEQFKKLIAQGADINEKGKYGKNALHVACCYKGRGAIIRLLIDHGANVNARDVVESTPLHFAARYADKQTVELLLSKGADVNAKNKKKGRTPLFEAMTSPIAGRKEVVELLVAKGAKVSAFHLAAYMGDMGKLEKYLQEGINVNTPGEFNNTALHAASNSGKKNIVEFLISKGALVDAKDAFSMTPLFYAACNNYTDIVDLLLAEGADVNAKDKRGYTLLYYAVWLANKNAITILIDKGSNVNVKDVSGYTPLHLVTIQGKKELAELLITKGAYVNAIDNEGRTPLWHAKNKGHSEVVALLLKHGAKE